MRLQMTFKKNKSNYEIAINNKFAQAIENHRTPIKNKNHFEINTNK
jgi:Leu/Phe-tRNA-protein transferase